MNILVVSPHPDDETLGAGGTILRLMQEGNAVSWLNITGIQGNPNYSKEYRENLKTTFSIDLLPRDL